jgi:hypothetical protein
MADHDDGKAQVVVANSYQAAAAWWPAMTQ